MKTNFRTKLAISIATAACSVLPAATAHAVPVSVTFDKGVAPAERTDVLQDAGVSVADGSGKLQQMLAKIGVVVIDVPASQVGAAAAELEAEPGVLDASRSIAVTGAWTPNDPYANASYQWYLDTVGARQAWDNSLGKGTTIAVVDEGVDGNHPDLAGGFVQGWDFIDGDSNPFVNCAAMVCSHGTHVAGIAGAYTGNGVGVAGMAPSASLMSVRVLDNNNVGTTDTIAAGIVYAAYYGANVINLSVGSKAPTESMERAVEYANAQGSVVVCAAGNDNGAVTWPGAYDGCLTVAATTQSDQRASFSNYGQSVDISAPGVNILSSISTAAGSYGYMNGTSMATPVVAGTAALLAARGHDAAMIERILEGSAVDLGLAGPDTWYGAGRLSASAALSLSSSVLGGGGVDTDPNHNVNGNPADTTDPNHNVNGNPADTTDPNHNVSGNPADTTDPNRTPNGNPADTTDPDDGDTDNAEEDDEVAPTKPSMFKLRTYRGKTRLVWRESEDENDVRYTIYQRTNAGKFVKIGRTYGTSQIVKLRGKRLAFRVVATNSFGNASAATWKPRL